MRMISPVAPFRRLWWKIQRGQDRLFLWPACKSLAKQRGQSLEVARAAFAAHAMRDPAWIERYGKETLIKIIGRLR